MALQSLGSGWWQKLFRKKTVKIEGGVPNRRCAKCEYEVTGVGPEPTKCPNCGQEPWQSADPS